MDNLKKFGIISQHKDLRRPDIESKENKNEHTWIDG